MMPLRRIAPIPTQSLIALAVAVLASTAFAQTPPAARPAGAPPPDLLTIANIAAPNEKTPSISFDVISIKVNKSDPPRSSLIDLPQGDGITITGRTLFDIMRWNFNIHAFREDQLVGVPDWFKTERFDIQAKVAEADLPAWRKLSEGYHRLIFRKLLVEQFKLAAHWAIVEEPGYNLVAARSGLKIKPIQPGVPPPHPPRGPDGTPILDGIVLIDRTPSGLKFACQQTHLSWFAKGFLTSYAGRQVYDNTGIPLDTLFNFTLEFTPEHAIRSDSSEVPNFESGPSLFTALQEQLGLKLEPAKEPVPRLVIDHVQRPPVD